MAVRGKCQGIADDEFHAPRFGPLHQVGGMLGLQHHRFFQHDVQAGVKAARRQGVVGGVRHGDDRAVQLGLGEHCLDVHVSGRSGEGRGGAFTGLLAAVADGRQVGVGILEQSRDVRVGGPPAGADDADASLASGHAIRSRQVSAAVDGTPEGRITSAAAHAADGGGP